MTPIVLLLPLVAAIVVIAINRNEKFTRYMALAGSVMSLAFYPLASSGTGSAQWFSVAGVPFNLTTLLSDGNPGFWMFVLPILVIGALVFLYSTWFMDLPSEQRRYYIEMLAFEAAMLAFVMAGNFVLLFVAWEFLSLTSYLLIGFWHSRERALAAARKAITMVLIGDIALLAAIVILQGTTGTLEFSSFFGPSAPYTIPAVVSALLLIAIFTKSAQFPFHEWLPDAMEGPTPVSAYLHSSTMVKAGVFAAIVLFPVFTQQEQGVMLAVGIVTAVLAMLNAMREQHVKRILAYSTVQELGLMIAAVGAGAVVAAAYFFFVQGFYKALLFFGAGVSMKATNKENLSEMTGMRENRFVYITTLFGVLGLAGFVPFAGFFASLQIGSAFATNMAVYGLMSLISMGTSFYIFRWLTTQLRKPSSASVAFNYSMVSLPAISSMIILAVLALPLVLPSNLQVNNIYEGVLETILVSAGAFAAYSIYKQPKQKVTKSAQEARGWNWDIVYSAGYVNSTYEHLANFFVALADAAAYFDARLNSLFDWVGHLAVRSGMLTRRIAVGGINAYVAIFAVGLLLLMLAAVVLG